MRVLVIAPHPDDEILGCGGSIINHTRLGDEVYVAIVTKGDEELFGVELIKAGRQEAKAAHDFMGIQKTIFLDLPAIKLDTLPHFEINNVIVALLKEIDPEVLYIPNEFDMNIDHRIIHESVMVAIRPGDQSIIKKVLSYETLSSTEWAGLTPQKTFTPNIFHDITNSIENKIQALSFYKSQLKTYPHSRSLEAIRVLAKWRGLMVGKEYVEAFKLIREIC